MNLPRVPAGVVAVTEEVLLSGLLVLGLSGEDADGQGDQNEKALLIIYSIREKEIRVWLKNEQQERKKERNE